MIKNTSKLMNKYFIETFFVSRLIGYVIKEIVNILSLNISKDIGY